MVRRSNEGEPADRDERLGEAIEAYLALMESGAAPDPEAFAESHPELRDDLLAAFEGLALVQGLVGSPGGPGPGGRLETGRRIAGYRIVRELGRGGMGVVYEAVHVGLDRPVALKVLGSHAAPDSTGRRRFLNEARTAAQLHHTHIVPVFDVGQVGGLCYYAMQRIEGSGLDRVLRHLRRDRTTGAGTSPTPSGAPASPLLGRFTGGVTPFSTWVRSGLRVTAVSIGARSKAGAQAQAEAGESATGSWHSLGALAREHEGDLDLLSGAGLGVGDGSGLAPRGDRRDDDGPPPFEPPLGAPYYRWVAEVGREAAEALGHAHRRGIIHRDIKPSNLLVDGRGLVWVADFGLARRLTDPGLSHHESLIGTPRYMSPEQARVGNVDPRSDLFSLGATLYELLTLRPPFEGRSTAELVEQIGSRDPAAVRQWDPRVPRDLETIVLKLLAKRPGDRYASAVDLADDLNRFLRNEPVRARRISPIGRLWRFAQRHPGGTAVTTAAAATVLGVSIVSYARILHERDQAVQARAETQVAMATVVRKSNGPNRRVEGLGLLKQAAAVGTGAELQAQVRREAVEFLVLRDVEERPALPTGRARGIAFGPDGARLAVLTGTDGSEALGVWDVLLRQRLHERPVRGPVPEPTAVSASNPNPSPSPAAPSSANAGAGPGRGGGRGRSEPGPLVAAAGPCAVVLASDGQTVRRFDLLTGAKVDDLRFPRHRILGLFATPDGQRLVTVEMVPPRRNEGGAPSGPAPAPAPGPVPPAGGAGPPRGAGPPPGMGPGPGPGRSPRFLVNLWDPNQTEKPLAALDPAGADWPLVAISPDGRTVATARSRKTAVSFWSTENGQALGLPLDTQTELTALALGPDNQLAAAGNGEVRLWDTESRTPPQSLTPSPPSVRMLRFSPQGSLLAVVGFAREIELWDTSAHSIAAMLNTGEWVDDVAFAPDGQSLAAVGQGNATALWAVVEPVVRARLDGFDAFTRSMAFRPDGLLALGSWKGSIRFWQGGRCVQAALPTSGPPAPGDAAASAPAATPTGRDRPAELAFDDRGRLITLEPDALRIWESPPRCSRVTRVPLPRTSGYSLMSTSVLAPSRDGRIMAVGLAPAGRGGPPRDGRGGGPGSGPGPGPGPGDGSERVGKVLLWRSDEPEVLRSVTPPPEEVASVQSRNRDWDRDRERSGPGGGPMPLIWRAIAVTPEADRLYLVDVAGRMHAWALEGTTAHALNWPAPPALEGATSLALSPDRTLLAVGNRTGTVTLIDTARGAVRSRLRQGLEQADGMIWSLAFAPSGTILAVGTQQGPVELWSLDTPTAPLLRLPGHRGFVAALAFDAQGNHLASSGSDRIVELWDLARLRDEFRTIGLTW